MTVCEKKKKKITEILRWSRVCERISAFAVANRDVSRMAGFRHCDCNVIRPRTTESTSEHSVKPARSRSTIPYDHKGYPAKARYGINPLKKNELALLSKTLLPSLSPSWHRNPSRIAPDTVLIIYTLIHSKNLRYSISTLFDENVSDRGVQIIL